MTITQEQMDAAIAKAVADSVAGLTAKNAELLGEVKDLKKRASPDPLQVDKLEKQTDDLKAERDVLSAALKAAQKDADTHKTAFEKEVAVSTQALINASLNTAMTEANVSAPLSKAVQAMFSQQAKVEIVDGKRVVKLGDKPLAEAIKEWSATEEGKHFVSAPNSRGGGATGAGDTVVDGITVVSRDGFDKMNPSERMVYMQKVGKFKI